VKSLEAGELFENEGVLRCAVELVNGANLSFEYFQREATDPHGFLE
jgi:hypothetical protein